MHIILISENHPMKAHACMEQCHFAGIGIKGLHFKSAKSDIIHKRHMSLRNKNA